MKHRMKEKIETKHYKPDKRLYLLLLAGSVIFIGASFLILTNNKWFTIIAGIGCSGIASVIVAWLIDHANCVQKEKANEELLNYMFTVFDAEVQNALRLLLETYSGRNEEIDIERSYTVHEIYDLIKNADVKLGIWDWYYKKLGDEFLAFDATLLFNDPIQQHNELYSTIRMAQINYKAYKEIGEKLDKESMRFFSHFFLCDAINHIEEIENLRNKNIEYAVREEQKDFIRSFQKAIIENKKAEKN